MTLLKKHFKLPYTLNHWKVTSGAKNLHSFEVLVIYLITTVSSYVSLMSMKTAVYDPGHSLQEEGLGTRKQWLPWAACMCLQLYVCKYVALIYAVHSQYVCILSVRWTMTSQSIWPPAGALVTEAQPKHVDHCNFSYAVNIIFNRRMSLMQLRTVKSPSETKR